jgi:cell wall-associated NlpC family hydrolase
MRLALGVFATTLILVTAASVFAVFGGETLIQASSPAPSTTALSGIPPSMLTLYEQAATTCPGLPWTVLAGIGTVESSNGTSDLPGVHSGANYAGAEGPMQFEPATFAQYDEPVPAGGTDPPSPYDPTDAVYAAARLLCANGAQDGADLQGAVFAYNHDSTYVTQVLDLASSYGQSSAEASESSSVGTVAATWALAQVGTPYLWGGETVGVGFDCSGLVQAAYQAAGVSLPRVAQDQYDTTAKLGPGSALELGDLVFFGTGADDVTHVGIYVGSEDGQAFMVDAPYTGADVRVEPFPTAVGASFGADVYVGATRPAD